MKEPFEDDKYYNEEQDAGGVSVTNFAKVLPNYDYSRYVIRFRALADQHKLSPEQRPKLSQSEFDSLLKKLGDRFLASRDQFLEDPKTTKLASKLLILGLLDVDIL